MCVCVRARAGGGLKAAQVAGERVGSPPLARGPSFSRRKEGISFLDKGEELLVFSFSSVSALLTLTRAMSDSDNVATDGSVQNEAQEKKRLTAALKAVMRDRSSSRKELQRAELQLLQKWTPANPPARPHARTHTAHTHLFIDSFIYLFI